MTTIDLTVLVLPEGITRTESPGLTEPLAICPAKPRKSRLGRLTHCTGMRNGLACATACSISTVSRWSIRLGPPYHGVLADGAAVMLSPLKPEIGIAVNSAMPIEVANSR